MMNKNQFTNLVNVDFSKEVLNEVQTILGLISPNFDTGLVTSAFNLTVNLYQGNYPGYQACNTEYHDLGHILNTFLTMARLSHGAVLEGHVFSDPQLSVGLAAVLFHDAGYIQEEGDTEGTGGKYTATHVQRSMNFLGHVGATLGLSEKDIATGQAMILYTDLAVALSSVKFTSAEAKLLAKILGVADILAQLSERAYLEKLLFLYREFEEGQVGDYKDEADLLQKTIGFYDFVAQRMNTMLKTTDQFLVAHFSVRWKIYENLYDKAIK